MRGALANIRRELLAWVEINIMPRGIAVNRQYRFDLDQTLLDQIADVIDSLIDRYLLPDNQPIGLQQILNAYQASSANAATNIVTQTGGAQQQLESMLMSQPYQSRISTLSSRVFNEMDGFNSRLRTELRRTLTDGMVRGDGMDDISKAVTNRLGVNESRALTITRTEINNAHRNAIWDQDQDAQDIGINTRLLWFSALSPTTREWHASRHGKIYTREDVEDFYGRDGNAVNCKCTQSSIIVDEKGNPLSSRLPDKLRKRRKEFLEQQAA
ncbi:phage minor head protein [Carnimonas bestiolae]|uniref:phage minor head protein n=1 Tax=Carnimonas bestiolae TaxID=3402172 RepID=UPI003F4A9050